ncbi:hypothetical protein PhCBS80983_g04322 [Powellomyces hirtus]|uniref:Uncharacterized protein n=1 Tax=Powellomyces hirtus TaxID=109895 RepID=A0A507E0X6_9FUNG|nr:hypothetical protein PhCBS80983_g04322 [Powellomyces hirtus]
MVQTGAILPRPSISAPCTCIWQALDEQRENRALVEDQKRHEHEQSTLGQVKHALNPLNAIPGGFFGGGSKGDSPEDHRTSPEDLPPTSPDRQDSRIASPPGGASNRVATASASPVERHRGPDRQPISVDPKFGVVKKEFMDHAAIATRMDKKAEILKKSGWLGKARPFKLFGKNAEIKVGELISYREDLVYILESLIPSRRLHDPQSTHPPVVIPVPHTPLCPTCQQNLAYFMYHSPSSHSAILRETATSAYLALLDDATASLKGSLPLEHISHHQLDAILRRELAVIEWRIAANLAKYHKKTGFLKEFPVRLGEYGEFQVNVKPPGAEEGFVKKTGKKLMSAVGLSSSEGPSGEVQGAAAGAAAKDDH